MGKTTLVQQTLSQLDSSAAMVGWSESTGERADLLLRAIENLYSRWLADATYRQQIAMLWRRRAGSFLESTASFMKEILDSIPMTPTMPFSSLIGKALEGLVSANLHLRQSQQIPRLSHDVAKELLTIIHELSERRIVLVLDNFERSPSRSEEHLGLVTFLRRRDIIGTHIILVSRDETEVARQVRHLVSESPAAALIRLDRLIFENADRADLLRTVRGAQPAARSLSDDEVLALIDGFPGVLHWWLDQPGRSQLSTAAELIEAARDAHELRYRDLGELILSASSSARRIAARVALLPQLPGYIPPELNELLSEPGVNAEVENLQLLGVLDPTLSFPSFGHPTRHEAAQRLFQSDAELKAALTLEVRKAIEHFAQRIGKPEPTSGSNALALLMYMEPIAAAVNLEDSYSLACGLASAYFLLPLSQKSFEPLIERLAAPTLEILAPVTAKVASAMVDAVNIEGQRPHYHSVVKLLDQLSGAFPTPTIRGLAACGYANAINYDLVYNDTGSRDSNLRALRELADSFPDEESPLDCLVRALAQCIAKELGDDISSPELLLFAGLRGERELKQLTARVKARARAPNLDHAAALNLELRARTAGAGRKALRDFLLKTIHRWIRFSSNPDLEAEQEELDEVRKRNPDSPLSLES
jgi:hypothetical protein